MFRLVIGQAQDVDTGCVVAEVIRQCRERLAGAVPGAGLLFSASGFALERLAATVRDAFPGLPVVGCTTANTFSTAMGLSRDSVSLALFVSDTVRFAAGLGRDASRNSARAAREAARMALAAHPGLRPAMAFTFPDGVHTAPGELVDSLSAALGCPIFGGFAGGEGYEDVRQFFGGKVFAGAVPILACSVRPRRPSRSATAGGRWGAGCGWTP